MSCLQKRHNMQNHFCLDVAGITIRPLALVTPCAVDFEAGDWLKCDNNESSRIESWCMKYIQGRSYRHINDKGLPSYRGLNMYNYSPLTGLPYPKKGPRRNLKYRAPSKSMLFSRKQSFNSFSQNAVIRQVGWCLGFGDWESCTFVSYDRLDEYLTMHADDAHFWLNGYVNKQNCRIWSEANPQVYVETPLHPEKLTVWCALWAGGILLQKR
ncbi:hypothetical protein TNCV_4445081 [Trichonephila clavipes]|nr:hypothetical protein TNCV_4445081 [Trichonephila clavipes]